MERFTLFNFEWNSYNGFYLAFCGLERPHWDFSRSLFSINVSKEFLYLNVLFAEVKVFDKTV